MVKSTCLIDDCKGLVHGHGWCTKHYLRWYKHGDPTWTPPQFDECIVQDCLKLPRSRTAGLCEMHYFRIRRNGEVNAVHIPTRRSRTSNGYALIYAPQHPLARSAGWMLEHRAVLFAALGGDAWPCHWCGTTVRWNGKYPADLDALVVDHLDGIHDHNDRANLVPSCATCNLTR